MAYYLITQGFYAGISTSVGAVYSVLQMLYQYNNPDLVRYLKKLDIDFKLKMVNCVLKKQANTNVMEIRNKFGEETMIFTLLKNDDQSTSDPLELNLQFLSKSIKDIFENLESIQKEISSHKKKWFHAYRAINMKTYLDELESNVQILDNRFNNYIKLCGIEYVTPLVSRH